MEDNKKDEIIEKTEMRKIKKLEPIELEDFQEFNYEWNLPGKKQVIARVRKEGSKLAGHYHKGRDPSKKPERFFIAQGKVELTLVDQKGDSETLILEKGHNFEINPYIAHQMKVISKEDLILIEYRISPFHREDQDTHYLPGIFQ